LTSYTKGQRSYYGRVLPARVLDAEDRFKQA